jgi:hypothetical protein
MRITGYVPRKSALAVRRWLTREREMVSFIGDIGRGCRAISADFSLHATSARKAELLPERLPFTADAGSDGAIPSRCLIGGTAQVAER